MLIFIASPKYILTLHFLSREINPNFNILIIFHLLSENYPELRKNFLRTQKLLPTSAVSAALLANLLPKVHCFVYDLDLYYPYYQSYKSNHEGIKPPHSKNLTYFA